MFGGFIMADKINILFVDDEQQILAVLKSMFEKQYGVFTATDGPEALEIVHKHSIQIIVSDQRMPEMQGIDLLKQIKEVSPNTVRILLAGYADMDAIMEAVNAGEIFRFIEKPWNNERLKKTIEVAEKSLKQTGQTPTADKTSHQPSGDHSFGMLVLGDDREVCATIHQLFGHRLNVYCANSLDGAITILEQQHKLAVFITDTMVQGKNTSNFIEEIKKTCPSLVSVVLTTKADAHTIVRLINEGQIFRYLPKPVENNLLEFNINAALKHYAQLNQEPSLLENQPEVKKPSTPVSKDEKKSLTNKLKSLRQRMSNILHH